MTTDEIVKQFEENFPTLATNFKRIQKEQYELFAAKQLSYGLGNIACGTELKTPEEVRLSLSGIWFRSNDKINRIKQLVLLNGNNPLENEPVEDAYKDLSVYSIISLLVKGGHWKK